MRQPISVSKPAAEAVGDSGLWLNGGVHGGGLGRMLRDLRERKRLWLAELAALTYVSRGWINNVEAGRRWPPREWVASAVAALDGPAAVLGEWDRQQREREAEARSRRLLAEARRQSELLLAMPDGAELDATAGAADELAVSYLASPPGPMLERAGGCARRNGTWSMSRRSRG